MKSLLITGGRSEIAQAIARKQFQLGRKIIVTASTEKGIDELRKIYFDADIHARIVHFDLKQTELSSELFQILEEGQVDRLVLNAASRVEKLRYVHDFQVSEINSVLEGDIRGNLLLIQKVLPAMMKAQFGRIVFISSVMSVTGTSRHALYGLSKAALEALVLNLAVDYGSYQILSNVLRPGIMVTERTRRYWQRESYRKKAASIVPQARLGQPEDIAEAIAPLLSETCYMNAAIVNVSGGLPLISTTRL